MGEIRSHAVVLHGRDWREADKLVTLLTREAGKVTVVARGVKKQKSKFAALVEPLTLGHFLLHRGKSMDTLIQGEIIKPYASLRQDLLHYAYGQYFCELCQRALPDGEPALGVFSLLVAALEMLEKDGVPARVARCFELNLLDELGFRPALEECIHCGGQAGPFQFDVVHGSLVCASCPTGPEPVAVSGAAVSVMRRFLEQGFHRLSVCSVPAVVSEEIRAVCAGVFQHSLAFGEVKSRRFLESIEKI